LRERENMKRVSAACVLVFLLGIAVSPGSLAVGFENGADGAVVGWADENMLLTTPDESDVLYYGVGNPYNMVKSDSGLESNEDWEYMISGNCGAWSPDSNVAIINFVNPQSEFTVGYSSYFDFIAEAYDSDDSVITSARAGRNSRSWGGYDEHDNPTGGLNGDGQTFFSELKITISQPQISYVKLYGDMGEFSTGGRWVIDNVNDEVGVPEWPTGALALMGMCGFAWRRCRMMNLARH
jgi:hypothetical protein